MNYAKAIRVLRAAKGMDQQELAKRIKLSKSLLSKIEAGQRELTELNKEKIATTLHVPLSLIDILATEPSDTKLTASELQKIGRTLLNLNGETESKNGQKLSK